MVMKDDIIFETPRRLRKQGCDDSRCEAKECASSLSKDVWESVSAFANTEGGLLLLGVSERNDFAPVDGFAIDKVCNQFVNGMGDGGQPGLLTNPPSYAIQRVSLDTGSILAVRIDELELSQKPCFISAKGIQTGSYKRVDDKDVRLSSNELYAIRSAMTVDRSDRLPVEEANLSDLDEALYEAAFSRARLINPRSMKGADTETERLKRLNFTDSDGRIMRAGLLVAGLYPQQFFPKLHVDVAVHPGVSKGSGGTLRFRDRSICEGTVGEMIEDSVAAIAKNLRRRSVVKGLGRTDELEIPDTVLREAVTNALIHRSYNERFDGEAVAVDVFDDRIEVTNPGGLWGKSRTDLADGRSCCRNATLMKLMSLVPLPSGEGSPAEGNGSGIPLMISEMKARGLKPPEFHLEPGYFKVVLWRPGVSNGKGKSVVADEDAVKAVLESGGEMSVHELSERCGLTLSQTRRRLNGLISKGEVVATAPPTSRNRKYRIVG